MKTLLLAAAVSFSISATAEQHISPPEIPLCPDNTGCNWSVGCSIYNGPQERGTFRFSGFGYIQAASQFQYTKQAVDDWYSDLRALIAELPGGAPFAVLVPDPESPLTPLMEAYAP